MNKSRLWIVSSLILLFAAGLVAGIFADKWFLSKRAEARRPGTRPPTLEIWTKELGLTVEQQAKIREIFKQNETRLQSDESLKSLRGGMDKRYAEIRDSFGTQNGVSRAEAGPLPTLPESREETS